MSYEYYDAMSHDPRAPLHISALAADPATAGTPYCSTLPSPPGRLDDPPIYYE